MHAVDARRSHATFTVSHLYVGHVSGSVPIVNAGVTLAPDSAIPTEIVATLDPKHIDTHDTDRDVDLQGSDWFDTAKFPTWQFRSNKIAPSSPGAFTSDGTLTVHGVTSPLTLKVTIVRGLPHPLYHAVAHVDRHAFGMQRTTFDPLIGNDVEIVLDIELS